MQKRAMEKRVVSRRTFLAGACAFCAGGFVVGRSSVHAAAGPGFGPGPFGETSTMAQRERAQPDGLFRVRTDRPLVALTFDDGPDPRFTPKVLDILADRRVPATFFVVGVNALAHRDLIGAHLAAGHTLGNHTFDHPQLELLAAPAVASEIERGARAAVAAGAPHPTLFRPPKGFTDGAVGVLADADRYRTVFWDVCLERFLDVHGRHGVDALVSRVRPGSIVLAHDGGHIEAPGKPWLDRSPTVAALPALIDGLRARGFEITDVPGLLASAAPV